MKFALCHPELKHKAKGLCYNCYQNQRNAAHRPAVSARSVLRESYLRQQVLSLLGAKCNHDVCSWTDPRVLQIDHIKGNGAEEKRKGLKGVPLYLKILKMEAPEKEYQLLCSNHNLIKKFANGEYRTISQGTLDAIEKRLQRNTKDGSCRQLVSTLDGVLARERAAAKFRILQRDGNDGGSVGPSMLGRSRRTQGVPSLEPPSNFALGRGQEYSSPGHGLEASDRADSGWANQADGFKR